MTTTMTFKNGLGAAKGTEESDKKAQQREQELQEKFETLIRQGRSKYEHAMNITKSITKRDADEFVQDSYSENLWNQRGYETLEKRIENLSDTVYKHIPALIRDVCDLETDYFSQILDAERNGWIDKGAVEWWRSRLESTKMTHFEKEKFMKEKFPTQMKNCRKVAEMRDDVQKEAEKYRLGTRQIPELADVLDKKKFLSFTYPERKNKVHKAKALILAYEQNQENFLRSIEKEMMDWVAAGWMHRTKVGPWMLRVMKSDNPEEFASKSALKATKNRWKEARERFDKVTPQLKTQPNKMRGFEQISASKFLLLKYPKRIAYLEEAESRLESDVNEKGPLAALRLDIRYAMDTGDWKGAELLLVEARKLDPDDKAVRSMSRYLESHRTDKKKEKEQGDEKVEKKNAGLEALKNLQEIMPKLPSNMRLMTETALHSSNPNTLKRLWQCFYNRHWVITNGYSDPLKDRQESFKEQNHEETEESIPNGHDRGFVRRTIKNDTANDAGVRDECTAPQVLYTNRSGITEVYEGIERNADNAMFGYWTTIVDDEVPYDDLREAVLNHMWSIKENARTLRESGLTYSSYGVPTSVN